MTGRDVLIDLGEHRRPEPDVPRTRRLRWARGWVRRRAPLVAVALAALILGTLTASVRTPQLVEMALLTVEPLGRADFTVDGDAIYLRLDSPITEGDVRRFDLADGRSRWDLVADSTKFTGTAMYGGALFVTAGVCPSLRDAEVLAVDPATGTVRWRRPGRPVGAVTGARLLVVEVRRGEEHCGEPAQDPVEVARGVPAFAAPHVEVVDIADGSLRWSLAPEPGDTVWYHLDGTGAIRRIVTGAQTGQARSHDAATGTVTATGTVALAGDSGSI